MFVEVTYVNGSCPLCGGRAGNINHLDSARDMLVNNTTTSYNNFVTYSACCKRCHFMWYIRTYSWIDGKKQGHAYRRNYVDLIDYKMHKTMLVDMVNVDANLLEEEVKTDGCI